MKRLNSFKRREIIKTGSQISEPIELTEYVIVRKKGDDYVLRDSILNKKEVWTYKQDCAGYCVRIGNKNYEFVTSCL